MTSRTLKGAGIAFQLPAPNQIGGDPAGAPRRTTGIGLNTASIEVNRELQRQVDQLKSERGAVKLDPQLVARSRWANRLEAELRGRDFEELKAELASAGGNIQPIKVRPLKDAAAGSAQYELVFGHRRHQGCLELGLPVLAIVADASDQELFAEMDRENRSRKDLSVYGRGLSYRRALEAGLYASRRQMAEQLGVNLALVAQAVQLAELPEEVVGAFKSPADIPFRWAKPLTDAWSKDPAGMKARAAEVISRRDEMTASQVLEHLVNDAKPATKEVAVSVGGKAVAAIKWGKNGSASVRLAAGVVSEKKAKAFQDGLAKLLRELA